MESDQVELPDTVSVPDDVLWQDVGGQVVLLNVRSGEFHQLDATASRMWVVLVDSPRVTSAADELLGVYDVEDEVLRRDLASLITRLVERGLLSTR